MMGIEQMNGWRQEFRVFEFSNPLLQAADGFAQELCPGLASPIVVLASLCLLGTATLLAGRLSTITSLVGRVQCKRKTRRNRITIFRFLDNKSQLLELTTNEGTVTDLHLRQALPR
jgi:hypothetical protein